MENCRFFGLGDLGQKAVKIYSFFFVESEMRTVAIRAITQTISSQKNQGE
jgi:hypothetical protein